MRIIKNFIKLRELTAEDRYRQAKGLPPKEDLSPYDILEKYKDDPMIMFSFRNEYYTNTKRLGVNLRSIYGTPNGIYCYPLSLMWKNFDHVNRKIAGIPFTGKQRPKSIVIMRLKGRGLDLKDYDEQDYYNDIDILKSNFPRTLDFSEYEQQAESYFSSFSDDDDSKVEFDINYIDSYYIWGVTRGIFYEVKPNSENTNYWNFIFSKILGYKWVLDNGLGIIYKDEPIQCVIFENSAYDLIDSIDISKIDYRVSRDDLSVENKLSKQITYLIANSSEKNNKKIKSLLAHPNIDVNSKTHNGWTLLHLACTTNNIEIIKLLLAHPNIDVNSKNRDNETPLYYASLYNHIEIIKLLLAHPSIDVNVKSNFNGTPLHIACKKNNIEVIKLLLEHPNIDVNSISSHLGTPLDIACENNYIEVSKLLLAHPNIDVNSKNNNGWTPLYIACIKNNIDIVELLLNHPNIDVNIQTNDGWTPLHRACEKNKIKIVKLLLSKPDIDVNSRNLHYENTALHMVASTLFNVEVIELLLSHPDIDVNSKNKNKKTPLSIAKKINNKNYIDLLIEHGATE